MSWLLRSKKINRLMSSYQILRIALQTISSGDWTTRGISMAVAQEDKQDGAQVSYIFSLVQSQTMKVQNAWQNTVTVCVYTCM